MKACYQKSTGTYVGLDDEDTEPEDVAKSTTTSATPATTASRNRPIPTQALLPKSPFNPNRHVPDVVSSVVPVPYRLLKLKIELLNILAILPKGLLSWNRQKNEVKSEHEGTQSSDEDSNLEAREDNEVITEADKQTPEMTVDQYIKEIQNCETYLHLFKLIQLLEKALPLVALFDFPFQLSESVISPTNTLTSSMVATYLYSLDRWIRYEDIPLDFFFEGVDYRPRMIYTPRCILSPTCLKYFHHSGRCDTAISNGDSRYKEILPKGMQVPNQSVKQQMSNQFQKSGSGIFTSLHQLPNPQFGNQARPPGTFNLSSTYCSDPEVLTLDSIQPYIPRKDQIKDSAWV